MKIVIANDYSFYMTSNVIRRYFELKGLDGPYFYDSYHSDDIFKHQYKMISEEESNNWSWVTSKNNGEICEDLFDDNFFDIDEIDRDDYILIQVVEELKPKNLKVVEIPDDVKWYIDCPEGGYESVHEVHRSWY